MKSKFNDLEAKYETLKNAMNIESKRAKKEDLLKTHEQSIDESRQKI